MKNKTDDKILTNISASIKYGFIVGYAEEKKEFTLNDFKLVFKKEMINKIPSNASSNLLAMAVLSNRFDIFDYLLTFQGWNLNQQNKNGETILQYISDNNHFKLEKARDLLNYGKIDTNIVDKWGNNPILNVISGSVMTSTTERQKNEYHQWLNDLLKLGFQPNKRSIEFAKEMVQYNYWLQEII